MKEEKKKPGRKPMAPEDKKVQLNYYVYIKEKHREEAERMIDPIFNSKIRPIVEKLNKK